MLSDEAGNIWLCNIQGPVQDTYNVWRNGKIVQKLQIPRADRNTFLFSDKPGSVYAWTVSGLQHLVADGPTFDRYRVVRLYPIEGISGQSLSRGYSKHGYLVALTASEARSVLYYYLHLVKLPDSAELHDCLPTTDVSIPASSSGANTSKNVVCNPPGSLTLRGSKLYGMSGYGGVANRGTVFRIPVEGGDPEIFVSFDVANGAHPWGSLTLKDATLYGMTSAGGTHNKGTVFSLSIENGMLKTLASFDGKNGADPWGSLTLSADGTVLYGMTQHGGSKNLGTVFSIPLEGGSPTVLASFEGSNGAQPLGSLTISGSTLYGATGHGGASGQGTIFSIPTGGGPITVLASFNGRNGNAPMGSLTLCGSTLYGTTWLGGVRDKGTVFGVPANGGNITVLASFAGRYGERSTGSLTLSNLTLYGMTDEGGANNKGTVFSIPAAGGTLTPLISFTARDRIHHGSTLALAPDGSTLFGMTTHDGRNIPGTVFAMPTHTRPTRERDIAEFIKPVLSNWQTDVERLKRAIRETVKPKPVERLPSNTDVEALFRWSTPVNGLAARIEYIWQDMVFLVRLKNVSDQPLVVPTANSPNIEIARVFDAYTQQGSSPWRRMAVSAPWDDEPRELRGQDSRTGVPRKSPDQKQGASEQQSADRPMVTLQPGEDCIAMVIGYDMGDAVELKNVKVVLQQPDERIAGHWSGVLETPPRSMHLSANQSIDLRGTLPFPFHFPPISYDYLTSASLSSPQAHGLNQPLLDMLAIYGPDGVRTEFARRMRAERTMPMKLLLASVAAAAGSEDAAMLFLNTMKKTDRRAVVALHHALWLTYCICVNQTPGGQKGQPPAWLEELFLAILSDHRAVTGLEDTDSRKDISVTVSFCATERLVSALGESRCQKAVPLLVERVKRREADWYTFQALGAIGDDRAVPALIEGVKWAWFDDQLYDQAVHLLAKLKARDAVPTLLQDIAYPATIEALGEIGDPRATPALREIVAAKGRIVQDGKTITPKLDAERLHAARVALTYLAPKDTVVQLAKMLDDPTLDRKHRYDVVLRLGQRPDAQAVPYLVKVIKTDSDYYVIDLAIGVLAEMKSRAAIEGLIECLDVTFKPQDLGKGEHVTAATCRNRIAGSLERITGQSFGGDKQKWLRWWKEVGSKQTGLK